jgi:hypothetical protein
MSQIGPRNARGRTKKEKILTLYTPRDVGIYGQSTSRKSEPPVNLRKI